MWSEICFLHHPPEGGSPEPDMGDWQDCDLGRYQQKDQWTKELER